MATLAQAEKAIVAAIKANTIAAKVEMIAGASQALGGGLTKQTAIKFPCIIVMFDGGKGISTSHTPRMHSRWRIFVGVQQLAEDAERKGSERLVGAHEIISNCAAHLHAQTLEGIGSLVFEGVENLTTEESVGQGFTLYSADFTLPIALESTAEEELAAFTTLSATWALAEAGDGTQLAKDTINLEQGETG